MAEYKLICKHDDCTGCMACANACAHEAIVIKTDALGFHYPYIDTGRCTGCGLCYRVCPSLNLRELTFPKECQAARVTDEGMLMECASGGVATALSLIVLRQGGVVVGCSGKDMTDVHHVIITNPDELSQLEGSKYVQSRIPLSLYREIRQMLLDGRRVLFIGTGCQVAGLQNYLIKPYPNLITIDIVCHGVPSQQMLNDNIASYQDIEPNTVKFRVKSNSSGKIGIRFGWSATDLSKGSIFIPSHKDPYMAAFLDRLTFRTCCYRCKYAYSARQSDLTICDFWGLGKTEPSQLKKRGSVSGILVTTDKGHQLFEQASQLLETETRELQEVIMGNNQLKTPSKANPLRSKFEKLYTTQGFAVAVHKTTMHNNRVRRILVIPEKIIKRIASRFNIHF